MKHSEAIIQAEDSTRRPLRAAEAWGPKGPPVGSCHLRAYAGCSTMPTFTSSIPARDYEGSPI